MANRQTINRPGQGYGYDGPSRRRRARRIMGVLRLVLGVGTAVGGGLHIKRAVDAIPGGSPGTGITIWLLATAIAVFAVVLLVSAIGWLIEWYYATHPPKGATRGAASESGEAVQNGEQAPPA